MMKKIETLEDLEKAFNQLNYERSKAYFADMFWSSYSQGKDYYYYCLEELL